MKSIYITVFSICLIFGKIYASAPLKNSEKSSLVSVSNSSDVVIPGETKSDNLELLLGRKPKLSERIFFLFNKKKIQKALQKGDDNFWGIPKWYWYFIAGITVLSIILLIVFTSRTTKAINSFP